MGLIFMLPSKWFAWFEYCVAILKVVALFIFMFAAFAMVLGAGPKGYVHHGETWHHGLAFRNGFKGYGNSVLLAVLAIGGKHRCNVLESSTGTNPNSNR
jgi:yeast amino acid transporter